MAAILVQFLTAADTLLVLVSELLGLAEVVVRLGLFALLFVGYAAFPKRPGKFWIQANGSGEVANRLVLIPFFAYTIPRPKYAAKVFESISRLP